MSITDNMTKEKHKEYWELVMEEYADSDLSKIDFCDANDINPSTFNYWENRLEELNESNEEGPHSPFLHFYVSIYILETVNYFLQSPNNTYI